MAGPSAVLAFSAVLALSGCGQSAQPPEPEPPPRYQSAAEVRDALNRSGLGCEDFQEVQAHHRDFGEEDAVETDTCRVDNQDASISTWSSLGKKQDWTRQRATLACQFADDMAAGPPVWVDGGFWTVRVKSRTLADKIAAAIGGEPKNTDCRSAWIDGG